MALLSTKHVPRVVVAQRVVDKIVKAAGQYLADETGEAMVGVVVEDKQTDNAPVIYVLDTIAPDESAVREWAMFGLGDAYQREVFVWLLENWDAARIKRRDSFGKALQAKWDVPLLHVGDWHKQPGFMIKPSMGDLMTALDILSEDDKDFLLVPIVTLGHPSTTSSEGVEVNYFTVPMDDDTDLRMDFWYIHRDVRMFQPMHVSICHNEQVPGLTQYGWHLAQEDRFMTEMSQIQADGLILEAKLWDTDGKMPLELCIVLARQGVNKLLLIVTPWNYPLVKPTARIAPFVPLEAEQSLSDVFDELWAKSSVLRDPPDWKWDQDTYLIDYIHALEAEHGLQPPKPALEVEVKAEVEAINAEGAPVDEPDDAPVASDIEDEETVP